MRRLVFAGLAAGALYLGALRFANWLDYWGAKRRPLDPRPIKPTKMGIADLHLDDFSVYDYRNHQWEESFGNGHNAVHPLPERRHGRHIRNV